MKLGKMTLASVLCLLIGGGTVLAGSDLWLHVRVSDTSAEESVRVNVPLKLVGDVLPLIHVEQLQGGLIRMSEMDMKEIDLHALLRALQDAPDAEYVTVESRNETVRVVKERGFLIVNTDEGSRGAEIHVRVPLKVVDALLSGDPDELNVLAAVRALDASSGDLVTVRDGDEQVRVWIDRSATGRES